MSPFVLPSSYIHLEPLQTLAPHLLSYHPLSLPLLRLLHFHCASPYTRVFATFSPSEAPTPSFAAAWVDRSRGPETECWIFSTYEAESYDHSIQQISIEQAKLEAKAQLLSLLSEVAKLPNPRDISKLVILGSLNECLLPLLAGTDRESLLPQRVLSRYWEPSTADGGTETGTGGVLSSVTIHFQKWLIAPTSTPIHSSPNTLPPGYQFSKIRPSELKIVISRTEIPKSEATLSKLGSVGIRFCPELAAAELQYKNGAADERDEGELVAWVFLNRDGSLSTLHVEPSHRGKGLAKAVSRRLLEMLAQDPESMGFIPMRQGKTEHKDMRWTYSDVAVDNVASAGVARGIGGTEGWLVRWVGVDLGRVEGAVKALALENALELGK